MSKSGRKNSGFIKSKALLYLLFVVIALPLVVFLALNRQFLSQFASGTPVTVTVNFAQPIGTSKLSLGVTHVFGGIGNSGQDSAAKASAESLLSNGVDYENRQIYGWGLGNPNPSKGAYNWSDLDAAVAEMRKIGGTPVITLCCSPGWMTSAGTTNDTAPDTNQAPTAAHYADFANLAKLIAQRYPDVTHFEVWNEFKGFNWDATAYTNFYNATYDALKSVNRNIQVGGPYLVVMGGFASNSGTDAAPIPDWQIKRLDYWLANKHGADFLSVDYSIVDFNVSPPPLSQIIAKTSNLKNILNQVKARPNYNNLPLWFAEDYCDANQSRLSYMPDNFQGACLTSIVYNELLGGASVSLRWAPGGNKSESGGQPDIESLFTDTRVSGGGQPYPAYFGYKAIHDYFGPGTTLLSTNVSDPSQIDVLASLSHTLLINKTPNILNVIVNGTSVSLASYQVSVIDTPSTTPPSSYSGSSNYIDDSIIGTGINQLSYAGSGWTHCTNCNETNPVVNYFNSSQSWDKTANDYVTITFSGAQIALYGVSGPAHGIAAVSIDGGAETNVDFYSSTKTGNVLLWTSPVLASSLHTLKIRVTGTKNSGSTGVTIPLDRVAVYTPAVDDSSIGTGTNQWNYSGVGWTHCTNCNETNPTVTYFNNSQSWDHITNDYVTMIFSGSKIAFYGVSGPAHGIAAFSIDGGANTSVDFYNSAKTGNVLLWTSPNLTNGSHTLKIRVTGTKNSSSTGITIPVDRVIVY